MNQLRKLVLADGLEKDFFDDYEYINRFAAYLILARKKGKVIGWAGIFSKWGNLKPKFRDLWVFINPYYRRRGIGTDLVRRIRLLPKYGKEAKAYPWDKRSSEFFKITKVPCRHAGHYS